MSPLTDELRDMIENVIVRALEAGCSGVEICDEVDYVIETYTENQEA